MICVAYWLTYLPVMVRLVLAAAAGVKLPDGAQFAILWIYISSPAVNGSLYIALHSSVKDELRRYLPRCRSPTVAVASTRPVGDGGGQRHGGCVTADAGTVRAPVPAMTSFSQRVTSHLPTIVL